MIDDDDHHHYHDDHHNDYHDDDYHDHDHDERGSTMGRLSLLTVLPILQHPYMYIILDNNPSFVSYVFT